MYPRTWLLSGIPRSGTSLCCRLAGGLPDLVALSEPLRPHDQIEDGSGPHDACVRIETLVGRIGTRILAERRAPSIELGGRLDDHLAASGHTGAGGLRRLRAEWGEIPIDKPLSARFGLLVKHNALFAALLPWLAASFPFLALVRNPLAVLASWQTVDLPIQRGRIPVGERFDPDLRRALDREPEPLRRQLVVLNWFFARYRSHLPPEHVIRYEDLVETGGQPLFRLLDHPEAEPVPLKTRNASALYDKPMTGTLLEALLESPGPWTHFYTPEACKRIAKKIREN